MAKLWTTVFVAMGSNVGQRQNHLRYAITQMRTRSEIRRIKFSSVYETSAVGPKQRPFLNAVISFETTMTPLELLDYLQQLEKNRKRVRRIHWGPRTLDLDVLVYGSLRLRNARLTLPHPQLHRRKFVLEPLAEIAPKLKIPTLAKTAQKLLHYLVDTSQQIKKSSKKLF